MVIEIGKSTVSKWRFWHKKEPSGKWKIFEVQMGKLIFCFCPSLNFRYTHQK